VVKKGEHQYGSFEDLIAVATAKEGGIKSSEDFDTRLNRLRVQFGGKKQV